MKSDPKECLYCQNNETLHNLMIEFAELSVSRVFLFKEQTYRGRCLVSYKDHVNDLNELSDEDRNAFMEDVARVTRAMQKAFNPEKINYGGMWYSVPSRVATVQMWELLDRAVQSMPSSFKSRL